MIYCSLRRLFIQVLAARHATSKLREFADLVDVNSFGFRGEALNSLCALSSLSIVTRTAAQTAGTRIVFDHSGAIVSRAAVAREVGTTVTMTSLFERLPVRAREFQRNIKREFAKMVTLLQQYAVICHTTRISCVNLVGPKTCASAVVLRLLMCCVTGAVDRACWRRQGPVGCQLRSPACLAQRPCDR